MANLLLAGRGALPVGTNWPNRFITRHKELKTRKLRRYDYRRVIVISGQYHLSSWYKDSPLPPDWVIATSPNGWTTKEIGLEWIGHFEKHTQSRVVSKYRLLVLDGHESRQSIEFDNYCKRRTVFR
jgi:hypothetical protein